jgi:hypothetical protein
VVKYGGKKRVRAMGKERSSEGVGKRSGDPLFFVHCVSYKEAERSQRTTKKIDLKIPP